MNKDTNMLPDKQGAVEVGHCLRKEFTAAVIHSLIQQRQSINLIGEKGSGKLRLLEDIRDCKLSGIRVVLVDLKAYAAGYSGLLREIHAQLQAKGDVPGRLSQLFEGVEKE
ncbi:MAG: hypothetical protein GY940_38465, partial [bacterium]|nr:hypothetical protein [bacterium]